jgi:O-6-methylguanine DNA methyltransferase
MIRSRKRRQETAITQAIRETPLGPVFLSFSPQGLHELAFVREQDSRQGTAVASHPEKTVIPRETLQKWQDQVAQALENYFAGKPTDFASLPLDLRGTPFQLRVWEELRKIPWGATISYKELAARVGNPKALRAVGQANGANPLPLIIPCHRVIAADGSLGGYSSGLERKRRLLRHEGVSF